VFQQLLLTYRKFWDGQNYPWPFCQYMSILFLLFLIQFAVACACLAITEESAIQSVWQQTSDKEHQIIQRQFDCCGGANTSLSSSEGGGAVYCGHANDLTPVRSSRCLLHSCCIVWSASWSHVFHYVIFVTSLDLLEWTMILMIMFLWNLRPCECHK
jgi:hypothetical protein